MANGKLFTGSISLRKLSEEAKKPHSAFYTGKDGKKYLNIKIWVNDEPDQFGNHVSVQLNGKKKQKTIRYISVILNLLNKKNQSSLIRMMQQIFQ